MQQVLCNQTTKRTNEKRNERKIQTMKIFVISDTHFGHANMIPYCGRPENFDEIIISNWNKTVTNDDLVIHLGDVLMGMNSQQRLPSILATLPGKKILCRGNHDAEKKWGNNMNFMEAGFDFVCDSFVYDKFAFSHCPLTPLPKQANLNWQKDVELNIHGHFHNNSPKRENLGRDGERDLYDMQYYFDNEEKYQLIQIEDQLKPFSLEEIMTNRVLRGGEK